MTSDLKRRVDAIEARLDAMSNWNEDLREENEALRERVAELEELVDPDPGAVSYENLTKEQKVFRVRKVLAERAGRSNGKAAMGYKEIIALFDGHPSPGHAYDLMKRSSKLAGYDYDQAGGGRGNKRVRVEIDAVKDETLFHAANKAAGGVTA